MYSISSNYAVMVFLSSGFLYYGITIKKIHPNIIFLYIIIISITASVRSLNIPDSLIYANYFLSIPNNLFDALHYNNFEIGFAFFTWIIRLLIGPHYKIYFFCISICNLSIITYSLMILNKNAKNHLNLLVALIYYYFTFGYVFNNITLRAGLAFSFFTLGFVNHLQERRKNAFFYFLISILFHNATIITVSFIFLAWILSRLIKNFYRIKIYYWIGCILLSYILGKATNIVGLLFKLIDYLPFFKDRFLFYLNSSQITNQTIFVRFVAYLLISIVIYYTSYEKAYYHIIYTLYNLSIICFFLFQSFAVIYRVVEFSIAIIFINLSYLNVIKGTYKEKLLQNILVAIIMSYFLISNYRAII